MYITQDWPGAIANWGSSNIIFILSPYKYAVAFASLALYLIFTLTLVPSFVIILSIKIFTSSISKLLLNTLFFSPTIILFSSGFIFTTYNGFSFWIPRPFLWPIV